MPTEQALRREIAALKTVVSALLAAELRRSGDEFSRWLQNDAAPFVVSDEEADPGWRDGVRKLIGGMVKAAESHAGSTRQA